MMSFKNDLKLLLAITAPSGKEKPIANELFIRLESLADKVWFDHYGNVLGEVNVGKNGPTVLLSAHMDTVRVEEDREVIQENNVWFSSNGPLGADDRAGIAIILSVIRNLKKTGFTGKVKLAFTREEEIGLCGSREIDPGWLNGIDLGIVVDRCGSRDVVVSNHYMEFCDPAIGTFFETVGRRYGMPDWQMVQGGSSDAAVFAELGVPSVNVSAGYMNEHTDREFVNIEHCQDTIRLLLHVLQHYMEVLPYSSSQKVS